jgi:uncharacterized protein (DUF2252 family)
VASCIPLDRHALSFKHTQMTLGLFPFLRATFYRWVQIWREVAGDASVAPSLLAVGDLHLENFGTWRDSEGRLIWGINDFDEVYTMPYTMDLVRLATSAHAATVEEHLTIRPRDASDAVLEGYRDALKEGGHSYLLKIIVGCARSRSTGCAMLRCSGKNWRGFPNRKFVCRARSSRSFANCSPIIPCHARRSIVYLGWEAWDIRAWSC